MSRRRLAALITAAAATLAVLGPVRPADAAVTQRWVKEIPGAWFAWSSPAIADLDGDGSNDVIVGGQDGKVYAFDLHGTLLPGWPGTALAAVASSPAVGDVDGDGRNEVVVGTGSLDEGVRGQQGGLTILNRDGSQRCVFRVPAVPANHLESSAIWNAPAIGDVDGDGVNDIVAGSFNQEIYLFGGNCQVKGQFNNTDSVWSAPALADVDGDGAAEIFIGGDATASPVGLPHSGGYFRSLTWTGGKLVQRWVRTARETFQNGAAIADINGDGRREVVTGTGSNYCRHADPTVERCEESRKVWAFDLATGNDVPGWPKKASKTTFLAAPAIGDVDGDGKSDVVVGSSDYKSPQLTGYIDVFYGHGGQKSLVFPNEITAPPVVADVNGSGPAEVLVGTNQLTVLDGALNVVQSKLAIGPGSLSHNAAAAVGELGPGRWALVSTGWGAAKRGYVYAYDIPKPTSVPWGQNRKNALRVGGDPIGPVVYNCTMGYRLTGSDGGIFSYGTAQYFGSTGGIRLAQPIVGMTATRKGDGYWFVAADGGVFNYGTAGFYGSTGAMRLNFPVKGMAAHPLGRGYWLVASDGGIFNYGDAKFYGSTGAMVLNSPIVGMAATPSGNGYWLVAADGGIFNYGDAEFYGSTGAMVLNSPIVGMAASQSGDGYWLVAADGGIFSFGGAKFYGSTGGITLKKPIVGMQPTADGQGYWFVANDGGIFNYGSAQFCGAAARLRLSAPIVGMT